MVCLDESGAVVRDALLWNDTRSAHAAEELVADLGGAPGVGRRGRLGAGRVLHGDQAAVARAPRARRRPPYARRLPPPRLADLAAARHGRPGRPGDRPRRRERHGLLVSRRPASTAATCSSWPSGTTPCCRGSSVRPTAPGATTGGQLLGPGTGDNAASALGLAAGPGDVVVSIGTSGRGVRRLRRPGRGPERHRRGLRRRHRPLPPAGLHPERRPRPGLDRAAPRASTTRASPTSPSPRQREPGAPCSCRTSRASARPTARRPRPRCTASRSRRGRRRRSPARPSRGCSAGSPTPSTPSRRRAPRSPAGAPRRRRCRVAGGARDRPRRARPAGARTAARASTSPGVPPARPPGCSAAWPSRRRGK